MSEHVGLGHRVERVSRVAYVVADEFEDHEDRVIGRWVSADRFNVVQTVSAHCAVDSEVLVVVSVASVVLEQVLV